jgi:uncharacterized protein
MAENNFFGWIEIPVMDMERAMKFYQNVFGVTLERQQMDGIDMAWFPWVEGASGAGGSLVYQPQMYKPSMDGVLIYAISPSHDIEKDLAKVKAEGGEILMPKKLMSEDIGYMGLAKDSEGNRIAFHWRE